MMSLLPTFVPVLDLNPKCDLALEALSHTAAAPLMPLRKIWCHLLISWFYSHFGGSKISSSTHTHTSAILNSLCICASAVWSQEAGVSRGRPQTLVLSEPRGSGPNTGRQWVQTLQQVELSVCKRCLIGPLSSSAASIFSVKGIQLQKDPGKKSSMFPESGKFSKEGKSVRGETSDNRFSGEIESCSSLSVYCVLLCGRIIQLFQNRGSLKHQVNTV